MEFPGCPQGVLLSPGGAVVSTAPTKRQVHPNWCNLLCWCSSCSGKRQSRAETTAPPNCTP